VSATASGVEEDERLTFKCQKVRKSKGKRKRERRGNMGGFSWPKNLSDKVDGGTCVTIGEKAKIGAALRCVCADELKKINHATIHL
jgi:hypothetical protein